MIYIYMEPRGQLQARVGSGDIQAERNRRLTDQGRGGEGPYSCDEDEGGMGGADTHKGGEVVDGDESGGVYSPGGEGERAAEHGVDRGEWYTQEDDTSTRMGVMLQ